MRKLVVFVALLALAPLAAAQAAPVYKPGSPPKPHQPQPKPHSCQPREVGYNASGTLVNAALTPEGRNRYSGTMQVDVTRANHRAPKGETTFTLKMARVVFHHGVDSTAPAPGSSVKVHGKITTLPKRCTSEGFTPTITVRKVDIRQPRHPSH